MRALLVLAVLSSLACQKSAEPAAAPAPVVAPPAAAAPVEVALSVEAQPDGTLKLVAKDRWGGSLDGVYENVQFLESAVPTLERGLDEGQAAKLKAEVKRLKETSK